MICFEMLTIKVHLNWLSLVITVEKIPEKTAA